MTDLRSYRNAAFTYLKSRVSNLTQKIDDELDNSLRTISNLPIRPKGADTYNGIVGIKPVVEQRLLCLKLLEERLNKNYSNYACSLDYVIDSCVRQLNNLPNLFEEYPYKNLFTLNEQPIKKFNSPLIYKTNKETIKLMHKYEGCVLKAYADPGSTDGLPVTIG
jgi:hypothetical protein